MEHLLPYRRGVLDGECPLKGNEAFWDEAHPEIHTISIDLDGDVYETTFGLRDVRTLGRRLLINRTMLQEWLNQNSLPQLCPT